MKLPPSLIGKEDRSSQEGRPLSLAQAYRVSGDRPVRQPGGLWQGMLQLWGYRQASKKLVKAAAYRPLEYSQPLSGFGNECGRGCSSMCKALCRVGCFVSILGLRSAQPLVDLQELVNQPSTINQESSSHQRVMN